MDVLDLIRLKNDYLAETRVRRDSSIKPSAENIILDFLRIGSASDYIINNECESSISSGYSLEELFDSVCKSSKSKERTVLNHLITNPTGVCNAIVSLLNDKTVSINDDQISLLKGTFEQYLETVC